VPCVLEVLQQSAIARTGLAERDGFWEVL
jgi:hypothetical protein